MKAAIPTEEDVLAALLLRWLATCERSKVEIADVSFLWSIPAAVNWIAGFSTERDILEAAIADSERRLEVERARDAVVEAAREWGVRIFGGKKTNGDLLSAVCVLEAALMRRGAEVSRHGG